MNTPNNLEWVDKLIENIVHIGYVYGYNQLAQMANVAPYNEFEPITEDAAKQTIAAKLLEARIDELKSLLADDGQCVCQLANLEVCDHNWSLCNTVKDRIAELNTTKEQV